jgi:hypothetical protein
LQCEQQEAAHDREVLLEMRHGAARGCLHIARVTDLRSAAL